MDGAATLPPFVIEILKGFIHQAQIRAKQAWLDRQPWYRDLWSEARDGSGMREQMSMPTEDSSAMSRLSSMVDETPRTSPVQLYGSGGYGSNGLIEGRGGVRYTMPIDSSNAIRLFAGGGGAYGTIDTPIGPHDVHKFVPEGGVQFERRF